MEFKNKSDVIEAVELIRDKTVKSYCIANELIEQLKKEDVIRFEFAPAL